MARRPGRHRPLGSKRRMAESNVLFLSYARTDVARVDELFADLDRADREPWRDLEVTGGRQWWTEILQQIRSCDLFLFMLSPDSIRSRACRAELDYAVSLGRPIVPLLVRDTELDLVPDLLAAMVIVDVRVRSAESSIALLTAIDGAPSPRPLPAPMPEPPPIPLNELAPIADRLAAPSLTLEDQRDLLADLASFGDVFEQQPKVARLVRELRDRPDLAAGVGAEVDRLLAQLGDSPVGDSTGGEERAQRADRVRSVVTYLRRSTFTPILGHGLTDSLIAPRREIAHEWAETLKFPLTGPDRTDLAQVAQFVSVMNDSETLRELLRTFLSRRLIGDDATGAAVSRSQLADLVRTAWREREARDEINPQRVLAELDCPIYVNANPWGLLTEALEDAGKHPEVEVCRWRPDVYEWPESVFELDPSYRPTIDRPLVFHVFGALSVPESTVITEDDYLDFMVSVTANRTLVPLPVQNALADSSLLLLGFDLTELDTRVLLRTLITQEGGRLHKYSHVAAQVDPASSAISPVRAKQYLERYFGRGRAPSMDLYWGSVDDFARDLVEAAVGVGVA